MNVVENENKAKVPPPPTRGLQRGLIQAVPTPAAVPDNMAKPNSGRQDMNFKVAPELHKAFKMAAVSRNMQMVDLLEASFRCWVETYGDDFIKGLLPHK